MELPCLFKRFQSIYEEMNLNHYNQCNSSMTYVHQSSRWIEEPVLGACCCNSLCTFYRFLLLWLLPRHEWLVSVVLVTAWCKGGWETNKKRKSFAITPSLPDCRTAGCQSDSASRANGWAFSASHTSNLISLCAPVKTVKGLMHLLIGTAAMCVCVCVCVSEWLGLTPHGEWVRATLSHVCRRWTFKACMETVKRTYWLQALTLCTPWLPIFHPPWDIVVALCVCVCVFTGGAPQPHQHHHRWPSWVTRVMCAYTQAQGGWTPALTRVTLGGSEEEKSECIQHHGQRQRGTWFAFRLRETNPLRLEMTLPNVTVDRLRSVFKHYMVVVVFFPPPGHPSPTA